MTTTAATESKRTPCEPKDQKSFECVGKLSDKCEGKFVLDMPFWNDRVAKDDWTLPDCCSTCRKFKKEQREQRYKSKQSSSMIKEIEQDEYNDDSDRDSDHEYDGADDDYMLDIRHIDVRSKHDCRGGALCRLHAMAERAPSSHGRNIDDASAAQSAEATRSNQWQIAKAILGLLQTAAHAESA